MPLIPELYAKPVVNTAEEIRRIKEHYKKALDQCPSGEEKRQNIDIRLHHKGGYLVVKVVSTFRLSSVE